MTDPKHLAMTNEEMNALAARWERLPEEARNSYLEQMSRAQKARFERTVERHQEGSKHFAGKLTTRQDVVAMIAMWQDRQLLPLAARLDSVERWIEFQERPFWRRWRVKLAVRWALLLRWLDSKGVRFYRVESSTLQENSGGEVPAIGDDAGPQSRVTAEPPPPRIEVVSR